MVSNEKNKPLIYQIPRFTTGIGQRENPDCRQFLMDLGEKIIQQTDFELLGFDKLENDKLGNYIQADFYNSQEKISVLCNRFVPLLAFGKEENGEWIFEEKKDWEFWIKSPYLVLKPDFLAIRPDADDPIAAQILQGLDRTEFAEIVYRMPETIAEIVFHNWRL